MIITCVCVCQRTDCLLILLFISTIPKIRVGSQYKTAHHQDAHSSPFAKKILESLASSYIILLSIKSLFSKAHDFAITFAMDHPASAAITFPASGPSHVGRTIKIGHQGHWTSRVAVPDSNPICPGFPPKSRGWLIMVNDRWSMMVKSPIYQY